MKARRKKRLGAELRPPIRAILERTKTARAELDRATAGVDLSGMAHLTRHDLPLLPPERYGFAEPRYNANPRSVTFTLTVRDDRDPAAQRGLGEVVQSPSNGPIRPAYIPSMLHEPTATETEVPIVLPDELYQRVAYRAFKDNAEMSDIVERALAVPLPTIPRCACCDGKCRNPAMKPGVYGRHRLRCDCDQVAARRRRLAVPLANHSQDS